MKRTGFTLIELLVAVAIFALLSVVAYGGLNNILKQNVASVARGERLVDVVHAVEVLRGDVEQIIHRPVRDQYGDRQPAVAGDSSTQQLLYLTRTGHDNRLGLPRSAMQRVAYEFDGERLVRSDWVMLDLAQQSEPRKRVLLDAVEGVAVRFMDAGRVWHPTWPPLPRAETEPIPLAVEVVLQTSDWGEIVQLFRVPPT